MTREDLAPSRDRAHAYGLHRRAGNVTDERLHILASGSQEAAVAESTEPDGAH
jgi:acylphosphatase